MVVVCCVEGNGLLRDGASVVMLANFATALMLGAGTRTLLDSPGSVRTVKSPRPRCAEGDGDVWAERRGVEMQAVGVFLQSPRKRRKQCTDPIFETMSRGLLEV